MGVIAENLSAVRERIDKAARAAGRDPAQVRLVAVSKMHTSEAVRDAYAAGQRDFGENYVQELVSKAEALSDLSTIRWHFVGHLQTNKARQLAPVVQAVHGIDSARVALELGKRSEALGRRIDALVQVNLAGEGQKSGCEVGEAGKVVEAVEGAKGLRLVGLMVLPPWDLEAEAARRYFVGLRELRDRLGGRERLPDLSMGMSQEFEVAIQEGATLVRVGTAIFGDRKP